MVINALAAAAAALALGSEVEQVSEGLGEARLSPLRMALTRTAGGAVMLNDAYNANPTSMAAALRALAELPAVRRVAIVGTMAELGESHQEDHLAVAGLARELGIRLLAVREPAYGLPPSESDAEVLEALGPVGPDDAVLVKASRSVGLEKIAEQLAAQL